MFQPLSRERISQLCRLEPEVFAVPEPECGRKAVVSSVPLLSEGQARKLSVRIEDSIGILYKIQRRVGVLLECLCPYCVVIVSVVVGTGQRDIEEGSARELGIEVESHPCEVDVKTVGKFRTVAAADQCTVVLGNLSVSVEVTVLDVAYIRA